MIRINLHPVRTAKKVQAGKRQLLLFVLFIVLELGVMTLLYMWKSGEIEDLEQKSRQLTAKRDKLKKEVGDFDKLKQQRDRLMAQRNIINKLQKARTGPVWMMRELSAILTPSKGPTVDPDEYARLTKRDPTAGYNPRWKAQRLWLDSFTEQNKNVKITGHAQDYDDVAEFSKRIALSQFFDDVRLLGNWQYRDAKAGQKRVKFQIECKVRY